MKVQSVDFDVVPQIVLWDELDHENEQQCQEKRTSEGGTKNL